MPFGAAPATEEAFRQAHNYQPEPKVKFGTVLKKHVLCSKETIPNLFPIVRWLPKYKVKSNIFGDIVAGITVAVMHIPHGLAYSQLGNVPPVNGLYMAVFPIIIYVVMGTSRHISLGTFAVMCAMAGDIVSKTTHEMGDASIDAAISVASTITLVVGLWQVAMSLMRLGALTMYMSKALVGGFTAGAAVHVFTYQFKNLLGIRVNRHSGPLKLIYIYMDIIENVKDTNLVTLGLSLSFITLLLFFYYYIKPLMQRKIKKCRVPLPIELIVVALGIILSYTLKLNERYGVSIVADVPEGLPMPMVPQSSLILELIIPCLPLAAVGISINLSMAKIFAQKDDYVLSSKQEILAYGMANIFSSFFQCLPSAASLSRSVIQYSTGGKTQLASVFSIVVIVMLLLFLGNVFEPVPYCVLSSIVAVTILGVIFQVKDLPRIFRASLFDGFVWIITFLSVVIIDIDYGLLIGFIASLATVLFLNHRPQLLTLGRSPPGNLYLDLKHYRSANQPQNLVIARLVGGLNFSNVEGTKGEILKRAREVSVDRSLKYRGALVLDMSGVSYVDPTASTCLSQLMTDLKRLEFRMFVAACNVKVFDDLTRGGFFQVFLLDETFATLDDAIRYATDVDLGFAPD